MVKRILLICGLILIILTGYAQTNFRSAQSGDWNNTSTWEVESSNGSGNWIPASTVPSVSSNVVRISAGHTVTVTSNITIDQFTIVSNGTLAVQDGVAVTVNNGPGTDFTLSAGGNLHLFGESYLSGSVGLFLSGNLYVYSLNSSGAITLGTGATGNIRTSGRTYESTTVISYSGAGIQYIGNGQPPNSGALTVINNSNGVHLNNTSAGLVSLSNLTIQQGTLTVANDNLNVSGETQVLGGGISILSDLSSMGATFNNLVLNGGNVQATSSNYALSFTVSGTSTLTNGSISISKNSQSTTVNFQGNLALTNGNVNLTGNGTGNLSASFSGDISGAGFINSVGSVNINFLGTGAITHAFPISSTSTISTLQLNRPGATLSFPYSLPLSALTVINGSIDFNADITVSGQLNLAAGTSLDFSGYSLQLRNALNSNHSGGTFMCNGSSTLIFSKSGAINALNFAEGSTLGILTMNRSSTLALNQPLAISNYISLIAGTIDNTAGYLTMSALSTFTRASGTTMIGAVPAGGPYKLVYNGTDLTTGPEAQGSLNDITSNLTGTLTLNVGVNSNGLFRINTGIVNAGSNSVSVNGLNNIATFNVPNASATTGLTIAEDVYNGGTINLSSGVVSIGANWTGSGAVTGSADFVFTGNTTFTNILPSFNNITVTGIFNGPAVLNLARDITVNGTFVANNIILNGATLQTIAGTGQFNVTNLTVNNTVAPVSVSNSGNINLTGVLSLAGSATLDADGDSGNGKLTIISTALGDGRVAPLLSGASITGNATVERRLPAADNMAWYISTAVNAPPASDLQDDFEVTGFFTGTSYPCTGCEASGANVKWYNEGVTGVFTRGFRPYPANGGVNSEPMVTSRGYEALIWNGENPTTVDLTGTLNQGAYNFTVSRTVSTPAVVDADGWNLIGNPYASSIRWGEEGWTRSANIDPTVWVWDVLSQEWRTYNYNNPAAQTLASGIIASGQGFWVYVHPGAASLSINETAKNVGNGGTFYRKKMSVMSEGLHITMQGSVGRDQAYIGLHKEATAGFDIGLDAYKLSLGHEKVSLGINDNSSVLHYMALTDKVVNQDFALSTEFSAPGAYTLDFAQTGASFDGYVLIDHHLNTYAQINKPYTFDVSDLQSLKSKRFSLTKQVPAGFVTEQVKGVTAHPNPVADLLTVDGLSDDFTQVTLVNSLGQPVYSTTSIDKRISFDMKSLPLGVYFVKTLKRDSTVITLKVVKR